MNKDIPGRNKDTLLKLVENLSPKSTLLLMFVSPVTKPMKGVVFD